MEEVFTIISITGTFAFAVSGALTAMNKRFDPFGVFIIAFATAVGGGTVRDVLVSSTAVFWLIQPSYVYTILLGTVFAILFRRKLSYLRKTLLLFDTLGLALYTVIGVQIGMQNNLSGISCIALGTLTGAFGGVLRDILVNDVPIIFKKEIYATISILGGILYLSLHHFKIPNPFLQIIPIIVIIILRLIVVYYSISFPTFYTDDTENQDKK
ncbi:MAG: trimeric intracellular cation channel family protein [Bacteroidales bacterium]|nr:trimeric intracellular cation channel family protein [Bacteroidales bacterium]MBN2818373.1 trimeric intracellular cation channel family protein [Bacteroidales bacterium]